jgi:hypothetical protein
MGREASLGAYTRRKAVDACRRSRAVDARIELVRFGGSEEEKIAQRELYVRSITESDYVLCMRGRGNWSYRFYETLSAGRVPVVVNTDMLLPLSDSVDWKRHCVWIELVDLSCLPEKILEFHTALDENAFERLQEDNRQLWLERLEPVAFWRETLRSLAV